MSLPPRHSLFWRLALLQIGFCLAMIWLSQSWTQYVRDRSSYLPSETRVQLLQYASDAERSWRDGGREGVHRWQGAFRQAQATWAVVVNPEMDSLSMQPLGLDDYARLKMVRGIDWRISRRSTEPPYLSVPFPEHPDGGQLILQLPERLMPSTSMFLLQVVINIVVPGVLALVLCGLIYRLLIRPLKRLQAQANALRADQLGMRGGALIDRRDELGELAQALDHMAERLQSAVSFQRQLLRDLSHEMRAPLSRLRAAADRECGADALSCRVTQEVKGMEQLIGGSLELVWLDTERPALPREEVDVGALWDILRDDACFESGWASERLPCHLPEQCRVSANLNGLAQALENILRNAIRHSPREGSVRLAGRLEGQHWHLWIEDEGPGVAPDQLEMIFRPFTRLNAARPGGDGFGLGLAIARRMVQLQGGELWAENLDPGLRLHLTLQTV
ncbi:MAG: HAMP domain-containing protein [Pseudomonas stutzeri]|uniref:sensor histidine kinase n=1 Tax=Stutzerimonas stutzeri TaxID=316 RepID=UPI0006512A7A|nr:sensor histidine kinase [Stutzerimonas stutzeri]NIM31854.1 HAMP domain-containing protein [Stutzerimonas stutzeri]NIM56484.1 HAMP domain-containing protein [Stutzerimonas stutzeri]NIM87275.1 HAMP domain-containing protein [Stutzerimonas stutzeri]NIN81966.1 HAMP domain-containing protein [Stutzerimonas stutzeri]NIP01210.1 HAMP domain-containing protein [Stutzerimonas stutzeri]